MNQMQNQVDPRPARLNWLIFLLFPLLLGAGAVYLGKDISWDLRNYHYYNPYSLLHWRYEFDAVPAQLQSFFNPLLDLPFYLLITYCPDWLVAFLVGAFHGLTFPLVFLLVWALTEGLNQRGRVAISGVCAALACLGPGFLSELGSFHHDNTTALLILTALILLVVAIQNPAKIRKHLVLAGLAVGLAVGLKLPNGVYAIGMILGLLVVPGSIQARSSKIVVFALAAAAGYLIVMGPWMYFLWDQTGNPLFPMFNRWFASTAISHEISVSAGGEVAKMSILEYLTSALSLGESRRSSTVRFTEYRFAGLWICALAFVLTGAVRRFRGLRFNSVLSEGAFPLAAGNFLLVFFLAAYTVWIYRSGFYRFVIALEVLVPVCILILLVRLGMPKKLLWGLASAVAIFLFIITQPLYWGRTDFSSGRYFEVDSSVLSGTENALVIMLGWAPISYVIPEFPANVRFLRPEGNLKLTPEDELLKRMQANIQAHDGPIFLLYDSADMYVQPGLMLKDLGLTTNPKSCIRIATDMPDILTLCPAVRAQPDHDEILIEMPEEVHVCSSDPTVFWAELGETRYLDKGAVGLRLNWDVSGQATWVQILVKARNDRWKVFGSGRDAGTRKTEDWVRRGMQFKLKKVEGRKPRWLQKTLATIEVKPTWEDCD